MKKFIALLLVCSFFSSHILLAQAGSLDPSFSGDGKLVFDFPLPGSIGFCVAVQTDGKIVVGGVGFSPFGGVDFALARLNPDGTFDTTFGDGDGMVLTNLDYSSERIHCIAIQPDGKIVVSGASGTTAPSAEVFATVRYNSDGSLDQSFGNQGVSKTNLGTVAYPSSMALQPDGKIVVAGYAQTGSIWHSALIRLNADGTPDATFSDDGKMIPDLGLFVSQITAIAIQPDGKIVATGYTSSDIAYNNNRNFIARFHPNGMLDSSFATTGVLQDKFANNTTSSYSHALALQQDGKIVIGGYASSFNWPMARYHPNGTLDASFDFDGKKTTQIPNRTGTVIELAVQPDGKIIAVGSSKPSPYSDDSTLLTVVRYLPSGALDNSFGVGGIRVTPQLMDGEDDVARGMALQSDGKIIVVGNTKKNLQYKVGIARYRSNLSIGIINNKNNVLCFGGNTGSATAEPFGGNTPYSYLWSNGQTTKTAANLSAGTYTVTVTAAGNGGTVTASVTITQPAALTLAATVSEQLNCAQPTVTATANVSGGTPGYDIQWENGENGPVASFSTAGAYQVTVTDANGCTKTSSVTVANGDFNMPTAIVGTGGALNCQTTQLALSGSGSSQGGAYSYLWTTLDGQIVSGENTLSPTVSQCGTYSLIVTNTSNGCTAGASTTVSCDQEQPHIPTIQADTLTCIHETVMLNGTSNSPGVSYQWTGPNGYTSSDPTAAMSEPGHYSLVVTNPTNACTSSANVEVLQNTTSPIAYIAPPPHLNCLRLTLELESFDYTSLGSEFTYLYSTSDGVIESGENHLNAVVSAAGSYQLLVTNTTNGCTATATTTVIQDPAVQSSIVSSVNVACHGEANGAGAIVAGGGNGTYSYLWSNNTTDPAISSLSAGVYTVTVTDGEGCTSTSTVAITQPELLTANSTSTGETSLGAANGTATASPTGGTPDYTFSWSNGQSTATITGLAPGSYTVTVHDANDCSAVQTVDVGEYECALSASVSGVNIDCFGNFSGSASVVMSGGQAPYTYLWSNGAISASINNLAAGNYIVSVTDDAGCATISAIELTEPAPLTAVIGNIQQVLCPDDHNGAVTINTSGGTAPYLFSEALENLGAGEYSVSVTDANGCSTLVSFTIQATDDQAPEIVCPATLLVCGAGAVEYSAPATMDNCSSNISTTLISGLPSGSFFEADTTVQTFLATDANGNSATCAFRVVVNPVPVVVLDGVINDQNGLGTGAISVTGTGAGLTYSWTQNGTLFSNQEDLVGLTSGVYQLVITDQNGCSVALAPVEVSNTVGIGESSALASINLYPNPATRVFQLEVSGGNITDARMFDLQGKLVYVLQPLEWETAVDIARFSNGVYYLRLLMESGQVLMVRLVKSE